MLAVALLAFAPAALGDGFIFSFGHSGSGSGTFNSPESVGISSGGEIYVADRGNGLVQKFNHSGGFLVQWDSFGFDSPRGVAVGPSGNVYVTEIGNGNADRVDEFSPSGSLITSWGSFGHDLSQFDEPWGVAVDQSSGNVFVVDKGNHRIQEFSASGTFLKMWGWGVNTNAPAFQTCTVSPCFSGFGGSGDGQFLFPQGVATDNAGNVYVADTGNDRIQKFNASGATVSFTGQFGGTGGGSGTFNEPWDVATGPGGDPVWVADEQNNLVQEFTPAGAFVKQFGGSASSCNGHFVNPTGVETDSAGNVYVADSGNDRIEVFGAAGNSNPPCHGSGSGGGVKCKGKAATIKGTAGPDVLKGGPKPDVIVGLGGKDKLIGKGGKDRLCGNGAKDRLVGNGGKDKLAGGGGNDRLLGKGGTDKLNGNAGKDKLVGGAGKGDVCRGGPGTDKGSPSCEKSPGIP